MLPRPRRARRRTASPVCPWLPAPFPSGDCPSYKRAARRRVHAYRLSEEFGRFPRRAMVQESGGSSVSPLSTGENDSLRVRKTGPNGVGLLRPRSPNLAVVAKRAAPLVPAYLHHPAQRGDPRSRNRRTPRDPSVPSLTKVANAPNALAVAALFSTMDAKVRTASAAAGESFEGCGSEIAKPENMQAFQ